MSRQSQNLTQRSWRPVVGCWAVALVCLLLLAVATARAETRRQAVPADVIPIGAVQGAGAESPYAGRKVTVEGVVTGVQVDQNAAGTIYHTFFVQNEPAGADGDPSTSDGIAVFTGRRALPVVAGDRVRVTGWVTEFYGLTELEDDELIVEPLARGAPLPAPVLIDNVAAARMERYEGMRVALPPGPAAVVGATHAACGFAVMAPGDQIDTPRVFRVQAADPIDSVIPVLYETDVACPAEAQFKAGDTVAGLTGVLTYHFDQFKLVLDSDAPLDVRRASLATPAPAPARGAGTFAVATLNVENLFDASADSGHEGEPLLSADIQAARRRKLALNIADYLRCPTLVGVQEVENAALLAGLSAELQDACGFNYGVVHEESDDARGIDVALLVDPTLVQVTAAELAQTCTTLQTGLRSARVTCAAGEAALFSRPPLVVELRVAGEPMTVIVNHFKSKRGGAAETEPRRLAQAAHVNALVDERLAVSADAAIIVLGDFNDYELSPPMLAMTAGSGRLTNVVLQVPREERYTYVFSGVAQALDGILVSPALVDRLSAVGIVHANADYPAAWREDVTTERLPFAATDHDPPYAHFRLLGVDDGALSAEASALPEADVAATAAPDPSRRYGLWVVLALVAGATAAGAWLARRRGPS